MQFSSMNNVIKKKQFIPRSMKSCMLFQFPPKSLSLTLHYCKMKSAHRKIKYVQRNIKSTKWNNKSVQRHITSNPNNVKSHPHNVTSHPHNETWNPHNAKWRNKLKASVTFSSRRYPTMYCWYWWIYCLDVWLCGRRYCSIKHAASNKENE